MWLQLAVLALASSTVLAAHECPVWGYSRVTSGLRRRTYNSKRYGKYRIFGGTDAKENAYPWMASLQMNLEGNFSHACGATLINQRWLITAAHCFPSLPEKLNDVYRVVLGEHDLSEETGNEKIMKLDAVVMYPMAQGLGVPGKDIALIRLREKADISELIKPVLLPREEVNDTRVASDQCVVIGWGKTEKGLPDKLQQLELNIRTGEECYEIHKQQPLTYMRWNKDKLLCPELKGEGQGACQGDSGGPLLCRTKNLQYTQNCSKKNMLRADSDKRCEKLPWLCKMMSSKCKSLQNGSCNKLWRLVGVVSKGIGCGKRAGVYVKVRRFLKWIKDTTKE